MNGMDDNEDEHNFSDDGFDELNHNVLNQLEQNAILSTQRGQGQSQTFSKKPAPTVLPQNRAATVIRHPLGRVQPNASLSNAFAVREQNSLGEDFDDDSFEWVGDAERVPTPVDELQAFVPPERKPPSEMTQREQWRKERFGRQRPPGGAPAQESRDQQKQANAAPDVLPAKRLHQDITMLDPGALPDVHTRPLEDGDALQAQIAELKRQRDRLSSDLDSAKETLLEQRGEIDIIRENKIKEAKIADRQMVALKKAMQEESMKYKAALESLAKKKEEVETQNQFLNRELAQESEKARSLVRRFNEQTKNRANDLKVSPRKGPANSMRDGFDDDEVMAASPIKPAKRSMPPTPTAAGKRKRKIENQSPIKPLDLRQVGAAPLHPDQAQVTQPAAVNVAIHKDRYAQRHLRFIQKILNYQPRFGGERLVETMVKYSFPSDAKHFSSIVLDATGKLSGPELPSDCLQIFVNLWSRCIKEKYYEPVLLLISTVDYILDIQPDVLHKALISILLTCITSTIDVNAFARFKHSPMYHNNLGQFRSTPQSALNELMPTQSGLQLLYKVVCLTYPVVPLHAHLWGTLSTDFILMMLNPWQPIPDILLVFSLLTTSILPTTFGNICSDPAQQPQMENYIIDRLCYLLWEVPKVDEGLPNPSRAELITFRLAAMTLLGELAFASPPPFDKPSHGSSILARHPSAIARIVRCLYDAIATLYQLPGPSILEPLNKLINLGVKILYQVISLHGDEIDLSTKLAAVNGGIHRHRVVLTRLAFSEGLYVDSGITDETVRMATSMLEDSVTPDEAEMMIEAFPGFEGRKAARVSPEKQAEEVENEGEQMDVDAD